MAELCEGCKDHLEAALRVNDPAKKDYHIREVLQTCGVENAPEDFEPELTPLSQD